MNLVLTNKAMRLLAGTMRQLNMNDLNCSPMKPRNAGWNRLGAWRG